MKTLKSVLTAAAVSLTMGLSANAFAAGGKVELDHQDWSFSGMTGTFDKDALARGFHVFKNACAGCHSLEFISFRNFKDIGFTEAEIKAIIADDGFEVMAEPNEEGEVEPRLARLSDPWPQPYANPQEAAATNNGKAPPDLSLMAKARTGGPDYIYSLLTGYVEPTKENLKKLKVEVFDEDTQHLNKVFPGHVIVMPAPLSDETVEYLDGTPMTMEQHARDVTEFLMWTAEPKLEERKQMGLKVLIFLFIFSILAYLMHRHHGHRAKARQKEEGGPWDG